MLTQKQLIASCFCPSRDCLCLTQNEDQYSNHTIECCFLSKTIVFIYCYKNFFEITIKIWKKKALPIIPPFWEFKHRGSQRTEWAGKLEQAIARCFLFLTPQVADGISPVHSPRSFRAEAKPHDNSYSCSVGPPALIFWPISQPVSMLTSLLTDFF